MQKKLSIMLPVYNMDSYIDECLKSLAKQDWDDDVEVIYNVSMPIASTEMVANLKALQEMGAISRETIMEKTEYVSDVEVEKKRLASEEKVEPKDNEVPKDKEKPSDEVGKE